MNHRLSRLFALSAFEWKVLLIATFMLPLTALLLRLRGYNRTRKLLGKFTHDTAGHEYGQKSDTDLAKIIARMVFVAMRFIPLRFNCLRQSIVLWWLLSRNGLKSEIRFGVAKKTPEDFNAHAWVEYEGVNLCDSDALQQETLAFTSSS